MLHLRLLHYIMVITIFSACANVESPRSDVISQLEAVIKAYMGSRIEKRLPIEEKKLFAFAAARGVSFPPSKLKILSWETDDTFLLIRYIVHGPAGDQEGTLSVSDGPP
jgi:hypothetical protein